MRNKVSAIQNIPWAGVTANSLNKNAYEQRVLNDYVKTKRFNIVQFKNDLIDKCQAAGNWEIEDDLGNKQTITKDSSVCRNCSAKVWERILYCYRDHITNELPNNVKNRANCWYGKDCRTQGHRYAHAAKLNHI